MTARLVPIDDLNGLSRSDFVAALRPLFEAADPLADALYAQRPFASYAVLLDTAERVLEHLSREQQLTVANAHPRIGAAAATLSELSRREQGATTADVDQQLQQLNDAYEARFGHRFVVFVNRRPRAAILEVLRQRLNGTPEDELRTALHDMIEIARDRLRTLS